MPTQSGYPDEVGPLDEAESELHLEEYWATIIKRRRLIVLCVGTTLLAAALYWLLAERTYKATAILDVEVERSNPLDIGGASPAYYTGPEFQLTQARLMETREIAERVAKRLNLVDNKLLNPPDEGLFNTGLFKSDTKPTPAGELSRVVSKVKSNIDATAVRDENRITNLVQLSAVAPSPRLAADIANAAADAFVEWNLESKFGPAARASEYLAPQIQETRRELDAKEQQLLAYSKEKDIATTDPQANLNVQKLNFDAAVADRVAKEARYRDIQSARPESIADTLAGGLVSQLRAEQARLEREYAEKLNLFKPDWPAMRQMKAQIDNGREHLASVIGETVAKARETARNDYLNALRREESLKSAMKSERNETLKFVGYNSLKQEVDSKRALLDTLLKRQSEVEVTSRLVSGRDSNIRVAERARPPHRVFRPAYVRDALVALFLGGALGIGLAFLLEHLDRSLRTTEQVEKHIQLPALGVIPAVSSTARRSHGYFHGRKLRQKEQKSPEELGPIELFPHRNPRSPVAERYRAFRAALLLSRAGGVRSILVSSTVPREGKTATAVNLAVVLGQLGKRVLLVDADLHKPRLHEIFRVSNRAGLVSILAENLNPERVIVATDVPDVFLAPAGPFSPNPSGLLSSEAMSNFLEFAHLNFDYVVIDAPPVGPVSDALVLGHQTDGVVLCIEGGKTPREQVTRVRDRLLRSNVRILGVLINNVVEDSREYGTIDYTPYYEEKTGYEERQARGLGGANLVSGASGDPLQPRTTPA